jgi:uncharacterized protein (DUF433 family)
MALLGEAKMIQQSSCDTKVTRFFKYVQQEFNKSHEVAQLFNMMQPDCGSAKVMTTMNYQKIITIEPGKRGGRPCIRGMRISVADVLGWLAANMSHQQILSDYPELTEEDIRACLAYAADRERRVVTATS